MASQSGVNTPLGKPLPAKKKVTWSNVGVGALVSVFEVTTLGQPFEVLKTQMAANRTQNLRQAYSAVVSKRGISGLWFGLIPWAWIESAGAGAALLFTAAEIESVAVSSGLSAGSAGLLGGIGGGIAQAYLVMGVCTTMKTAEITRTREVAAGGKPMSTFGLFADIFKREGIRGVNKGVNAVAIRQASNWGSRIGLARVAETTLRKSKNIPEGKPLSTQDKILASAFGGVLGCWNHPIEVVRIEMQSMVKDPTKPSNLGVAGTMRYIYAQSGLKGLFRGVSPRVCLSTWRTICMVSLADLVKESLAARKKSV